MVELIADQIIFGFPNSRESCRIWINKDNPDKSFDTLPLRHVDDYASKLSQDIVKIGGVLAPVGEGDLLELRFSALGAVAVKVGVDKQNALNGKPWTDELQEPQDYIPCPSQTSLKGFQESTGQVRRFQATTLKQALQDPGGNRYGGIQLLVIPQVLDRAIPEPIIHTLKLDADLARKTLRPGLRFPQLMKKDKAGARYNNAQKERCFIHLMDWNWWAEEIGFS